MADYRTLYFKNTTSFRGLYKCAECGKLFPKDQIEVDHRIPKKLGGTDDLSNLQGLCIHCNRSKGVKVDGDDIAKTVLLSAMNGSLDKTMKSAVVQTLLNTLGVPYRRR